MREIKFRGIAKSTGQWVYGSLSVEFEGTHRIEWWVNTLIEPDINYWEPMPKCEEVIPETVGQYTGLKDKNGVEVYEGDKVNIWLDFHGTKELYTGTVIFKDGAFFIDNLLDEKYNYPRCEYLPHNSILISQPELYDRKSKDYIPNYGEVFTYSENATYVEVTGTIHDHLLTHTP